MFALAARGAPSPAASLFRLHPHRRLASHASDATLATLRDVERKVTWLSTLMIHHANNVRPKRDGLKVGGHQASSSSLSTVLTALYLKVLRPEDRVAVKPHAGPVYHALQYLMGRQTRDNLVNFRSLGGVQAYPSRTKDLPEVDFSTGSVGLGASVTTFAALVERFLRAHKMPPAPWPGTNRAPDGPGRMVAILGDAELDEGTVFEAILESWKHDVHDTWAIVDFNRQSLDKNVSENLARIAEKMYRLAGWEVLTLKYGQELLRAFEEPGGAALRKWVNRCSNARYSALTSRGGAAWRAALLEDAQEAGGQAGADLAGLVGRRDDATLHALMTNLGGHCFSTLLEAFEAASATGRRTAFIVYTIKGHGLPLAGHRDNHGLYLSTEQVGRLREELGIREGQEWEPFAGMQDEGAARALVKAAPINSVPTRRHRIVAPVPVPADLAPAVPGDAPGEVSTQAAFGAVLKALGNGDSPLADRILTSAPDVTTTTGLSAFVKARGVFAAGAPVSDPFKAERVHSLSSWGTKAAGQHVELGIAENNLCLLLAAAGLSAELFGQRLFPIGTLYDPFVVRALDSLTYACYMNARFILVGTPSGVSLAAEGGAHQSLSTPLIGLCMPNLVSYEPAYADEVKAVLRHALECMQAPAEEGGAAFYLRLTTRAIPQPERDLQGDPQLTADVLAGGYWHSPPGPRTERVIAFAGAVAPEAHAAREAAPDAGAVALLQVTSADALNRGWQREGHQSHVARLLQAVPRDAPLVTAVDAHPAALSWLGAVHGHRVKALGVSAFGESGDLPDLYRKHGIDAAAIARACEWPAAAARGAGDQGRAGRGHAQVSERTPRRVPVDGGTDGQTAVQ